MTPALFQCYCAIFEALFGFGGGPKVILTVCALPLLSTVSGNGNKRPIDFMNDELEEKFLSALQKSSCFDTVFCDANCGRGCLV